jgi:hypothetical protein
MAGHILLSKRIADDLAHDGWWHPYLHQHGECSVKHDIDVFIANLYSDYTTGFRSSFAIVLTTYQPSSSA